MRIKNWSNLVEMSQDRAASAPKETLYTFLSDEREEKDIFTYRDLEKNAKRIAGKLQTVRKKGDRIILFCNPGLEYIAAFFGCLYAGMTAVPAYPPKFKRSYQKILRLFTDSGATAVLASASILQSIQKDIENDAFFQRITWMNVSAIPAEMEKNWTAPEIQKEDLAFLQYTSGSTADPKGVMVSHGNLLANLQVIYDKFGENEDSSGVIWLPPYHDMGLIGGILEPLYGGFQTVLMSPFTFVQNPFLWLDSISRYRATTSGGPNFAYELCVQRITEAQKATLDLSSWRLAFNGAEPVRQATLEQFYDAFSSCGFRKEAFYTCYGLAEATLFTTGIQNGTLPNLYSIEEEELEENRVAEAAAGRGKQLVSNGSVFAGEKLRIVDPFTCKACPQDRIGEIWVSSPCVAQGYWNQEELTQKTFRAYTDGDGPYLRTGDLGFVKNQELYITGRYKDLIIIRGRNYYPQDLERAVEQSHEAFVPNSSTAFSIAQGQEERLVVVSELKKNYRSADLTELYRTAEKTILEQYDLQMDKLVFIRAMSLPKTSSGKVQRNLTREKYLLKELMVIGERGKEMEETVQPEAVLEEEAMVSGIQAAFCRKKTEGEAVCLALLLDYLSHQAVGILKIDPGILDVDQPLNQYGFDSLMAVQYVHRMESDFHITVSIEQILDGKSIRELGGYLLQEFAQCGSKEQTRETFREDMQKSYPLSHNQRSLFFMDKMMQDKGVYQLAFQVSFQEDIQTEYLQSAFREMVRFHSSLRTTFSFCQKGAVQKIHEHMEAEFDTAMDSGEAESYRKKPFDLENGPLFRVILFQGDTKETHMLLVIHHLITDFWSLTVMARELAYLYSQFAEGRKEYEGKLAGKPSYLQFASNQEERIKNRPELWEYWKNQLAGELPVLNLQTDYPRGAIQTFAGDSVFLKLSESLSQNIRKFCNRKGVTVNMLLLAAFQLLLHKYTGQQDILTGTLTSGRQSTEFAEVLGYFVNPVVLRADFKENITFAAFLEQVHITVLKALAHQEYPFDLLVEQLKIPRALSRTPVFQAMFIYQSAPEAELKALNAFALNETEAVLPLQNLSMKLEPLGTHTAQYDLTLVAAELETGIGMSLQYNSDLFGADTMAGMLDNLEVLLEHSIVNPELPISQLQILGAKEKKALLCDWNDTAMEYEDGCLHQLFEKQAADSPDAAAVCFQNTELTYRQLEEKANRLAGFLIKQGLCAEGPVALCVERSAEMAVGLLGILKAGGYYIPLDPTHPKDRLEFIIRDVGEGERKPMILTQSNLLFLFSEYEGQKICLDEMWDEIEKEDMTRPEIAVDSGQLAYTIYTSGSTGKPKGVQISHRAVVNFMHAMRKEPGMTAEDILLSVTTISFDIAALEIFLPLSCGAKVVIAEETAVLDARKLMKMMEEADISVMQGTPAIWRMLLDARWSGRQSLTVLCGGEAFPPELAKGLQDRTKQVFNLYGPTETTIWSTVYQIDKPEKTIPIGHPIGNTKIYILDHYLNPVPIGAGGELYIGGDGVARGYYHRDSLTAERFLADPFAEEDKARMYRTGDLARYRRDGNLEYLGRLDNQVKVRGYRIETGEIETVLNRHPLIHNSVVIARENKAGINQLIAYLIPAGEETYNVSELRRFLKEKLPDYMIPSHFMSMAEFPQTPNGKLDRKLLPDPEGNRPEIENAYVKPQNQTEQQIADIWREVLGIDEVGIYDNFFELGGNSMLMVQIQHRLSLELSAPEIGIVELFQYPTIASFAQYLISGAAGSITQNAAVGEHIGLRKDRAEEVRTQRELRKRGRDKG